jgi:molybdopterin synthase catalytic subunit
VEVDAMAANGSSQRIDVTLVEGPLSISTIATSVADVDGDCGAHLLFFGTTRGTTHLTGAQKGSTQSTQSLTYEAYRPMAVAELQRIAEAACQRWTLTRVMLWHAIGPVEVGQASVAVFASSAHRAAVMEGVPWIMDEIKRSVPIWKQELAPDGSTQWIHR